MSVVLVLDWWGEAPACRQISSREKGVSDRGAWLGLRTAEPQVYRVAAAERAGVLWCCSRFPESIGLASEAALHVTGNYEIEERSAR